MSVDESRTRSEGTGAALSARDVRVTRGHKEILCGVSATFAFGQLAVIAGPNGAGKSTFLRAALGLITCDDGCVHVGGDDMARLSRRQRANRLAYVPQRSLLDAAVTVRDVVSQGCFARRASRGDKAAAVHKALAKVELEHLGAREFLSLSGGEQRLVLIARALATDAQTICLDEPTACLDIANRLRILALLRALAEEGRAIVCVLHELEDVRRVADHVVLLQAGRVVSTGSPDAVLTRDLVRAVYQVELQENAAAGFRLCRGPARRAV